MKALRVLILSELNNPNWVSVPLVGFEHSFALAGQHRVTLVTHQDNCLAINRRTKAFFHVIGVSLGILDHIYEWCFRVIFKGDFGSQALTAFRYPFYLAFEWKVWRLLRSRIIAGDYDVVLRLTPVSPVLPSFIAWCLKKGPIPFVLGPINGGLPWPKTYQQAERQREWISGLRSLHHRLPFVRASFENAAAILVGSSQTYRSYINYAEKLFFIPENGVRRELIAETPRAQREGPLRLVFVGRLVPFKACDLALKAAYRLLKAGKAQLTVVGEGQEREALEYWVRRQNIKSKVIFTGNIEHSQVIEILRESDILVFPSIREFGGGVVFEALAQGVVPLVSDYGGPGDTVHENFGYKIPLSDEAGSMRGFRSVLDELDHNRPLLAKLSKQAQDYAREQLSWEGKAAQTTEVLRWVLGKGPRPAFRLPDSIQASRQR